jgi:unsaturated rhamnogalacturonyl hydrolase
VRLAVLALLAVFTVSTVYTVPRAAAPAGILDSQIRAVAALDGEPHLVGAAGLTRSDAAILTLENSGAFDRPATPRRLVIVGGLGENARSAQAVLDLVRWLKTSAPARTRAAWIVSALPSASFDSADTLSLERWITFQAPDVLLEVRDDGKTIGLASIRSEVVTSDRTPPAIERILAAAPAGRSTLRAAIDRRVERSPLDVARLLAGRYPETPAISYIPAVAWTSTLRLSAVIGDASMADTVRRQTAPWVSGGRPLFGERVQLTSVAGTMVFADLGGDAARLAAEGARLAGRRKDSGIAEYGQGWTDDMFMASAVLSRAGELDTAAGLLSDYAGRLQREDGVFVHATDGPFAWGRGNGFAALGLMELLTVLPASHPARARLLAIYRRQMAGVRPWQSPDGMWREVVDEPGAYREETATAMLMTAMARGLRFGWLDSTYTPVVEQAWRALAAHVRDDGTVVDVCTGTGVGPTKRYYLDRAAVTGADDRGGAMALLAAMEMVALDKP